VRPISQEISPRSIKVSAAAPLRWRALACVLLVLALSLLCAVAVHLLSQQRSAQDDPTVLRLTDGLRWSSDALTPPDMPATSGAAQDVPVSVHLPLHLRDQESKQAQWVMLPFTLQSDASEAWLLSLNYRPTVLVYLDGRLLSQSVHPSKTDRPLHEFRLGRQLLQATVPPAWLAQGDHVLQLRLRVPSAAGSSLDVVRLGPREAIEAQDRTRRIWMSIRAATMIAALVVGLFLMLVWFSNREALVYALAGAHVLLLALLLSPYVLPEQPLPSPWWRMLLDAADVLAKALMLGTVAALAQPPARMVFKALLIYVVLGLVLDLSAAWANTPWSDFGQLWPWWALGSRFALLLAAAVLALREVWLTPNVERMGTAALVLLSWLLWSYVSFFALVQPNRLAIEDVNVIAHAGWVLWVGALLQRNFANTSQRERELRAEASQALALRTHELRESFAALQLSEAQRLAANERERLLQEMHDGLGSQLLSAKLGAQAGNISSEEMVDALDVCIKEMRLAVDVLSVADGDLGLLLASVRHRIEPGLRAAGLALIWRVSDTPNVPALEGSAGRELVRIVQEAFSNVMNHAQATRVLISTELEPGGLAVTLVISDDGCGMGVSRSTGHGTRNIRQRAQRLGASVEWRSPADETNPMRPGTELRLRLPMARAL